MKRALSWLPAAFLVLVGCGQDAPAPQSARAPQHTVLSGDLSQLRSRFNADAGKVRAIFLAAPT